MAGILKPGIADLGNEIISTIIDSTTSNVGWGGVDALFDEKNDNTAIHSCYWSKNQYIEINISKNCNIWRLGTNDNCLGKFTIQKYNEVTSNYEDVTSLYSQNISSKSNIIWEKTISNLSSGQYRFIAFAERVDGEWYLESINHNKYLIKDNNNILYTYDGTNIIESLSQILDSDNFINNGFDKPILITEDIWNSKFPDKTGLQLLMYTDDTTKTEATITYNVDEYRPIDKLQDQFQIKKYIPNS